MPGREQERSELKKRALVDLDRARLGFALHSERAAAELSPAAIVERSIRKHRVAWIVGASAAGLMTLRFILPSASSKNERDNSAKSGTKGRLFGLLTASLIAAGRKAAITYATKYFQNHIKQSFQASAHPEDKT